MRRAAKVDGNQKEIVDALRKAGATVQPLHTIGKGCPDLLVGKAGKNYLFEIKDSSKPPSKRHLTNDQVDWYWMWRGSVSVITTAEEALEKLR